jgi:hypothetical protein
VKYLFEDPQHRRVGGSPHRSGLSNT